MKLNDWQRKNLTKAVIECAEEYGLALPEKFNDEDKDFWNCHGKWIIKHDGCEIIANKENIKFKTPKANFDASPNIALLIEGYKVSSESGEIIKEEWSFGEACARNTKMGYWWAMAEKRGKDRVILKLINAYERGIYSESEADDWNQLAQKKAGKPAGKPAGKSVDKSGSQDSGSDAKGVENANNILDGMF